MNNEPWYVELFRPDYYRGYAPRIDPEQTARQVDFVVQALALEPGARVLDLACGRGRHAVPLAQRGYAVTGLDVSAYHLRLARRAALEAGVRPRWVQDDMREIPFVGEFDAVISMYTSFGYFESDEEDFRVLAALLRDRVVELRRELVGDEEGLEILASMRRGGTGPTSRPRQGRARPRR